MLRTKTCPTCGTDFSYPIARGNDRKHCSPKCRALHRKNKLEARISDLPKCVVPECGNKANRIGARLCEMHYCRQIRNGSLDGRVIAGRYKTGAGYVKLLKPGHPLADSHGHVAEHRLVAYQTHDGHCPSCFWCGVGLDWKSAVVDHLNEVKADNSPANLVVACNDCNRARGAMLPFIRRMMSSSFPVMVESFMKYRARHAPPQGA